MIEVGRKPQENLRKARVEEHHFKCAEQLRRTPETQNYLNILIGSILEDELSEEPVILHDGGQFSDDVLTNDEWKSHVFLEEPNWKAMLTARVHVFSDSIFCTGPRALKLWKESSLRLCRVITSVRQKRGCRSID